MSVSDYLCAKADVVDIPSVVVYMIFFFLHMLVSALHRWTA